MESMDLSWSPSGFPLIIFRVNNSLQNQNLYLHFVKNCTPYRFLLCQVWSELRSYGDAEVWSCKKGERDDVASAYVLHPL